MIDRTRASRRLGIVGAAAVVGLVPMSVIGASSAFAATAGTLTLSTNAAGATSTATDTFTTTNPVPGITGTITVTSTDLSGAALTLPAATGDYSVSYTPAGGVATADPSTTVDTPAVVGPPSAPGFATITVTNPIPSGAAVTVTISGVTNPGVASSDYFTNETTGDTAAANTNTVTIAAVTSAATVVAINPTAFTSVVPPAVPSEPFTVAGTNFSPTTAGGPGANNSPVVCFVQSGQATPSEASCAAGGAPPLADGSIPYAPASLTGGTSTELQGIAPALTAAKTYNLVVFTYDSSSTPPAYLAASGTSAATLAGVGSALNFVPESGVRVVDSRIGLTLPKGTLPVGSPVAIPLSSFNNSLALPTNLPAGVTALSLNVTAVAPSGPGNLQVYSSNPGGGTCGSSKLATVNFQSPQDTNNSVVVPINAASTALCIVDNGASVNAVMDLTGYATNDYLSPLAAPYSLTSNRVLDTRSTSQVGSLLGPLAGGTVYRFQLPAVLEGATVALNVADVAPSSVGNLRIFPEPTSGPPAPSAVPTAAVDTYIPGTDGGSLFITTVPAGAGANAGYLDLYSAGPGTVNAVVDVVGVFQAGSSVSATNAPFRVYDSRPGGIASGATVTATAAPSGSGSNFVPGGALGVIGDLADINPASVGNLRTFPAAGLVPGTASIANYPGQTRSSTAVVALNPSNGGLSIESSGSATNATFDATAYIPN